MDLELAGKRTRNAAIVTIIMAVLGTLYWLNKDDSPAEKLTDGLVVVFLQGAAVALFKHSRATAVFLFSLTVWIVGAALIRDQYFAILPMGITFLYLYFQGTRGAFAYHRLRKEADSTYQSVQWWMWLVGVPFWFVVASYTVAAITMPHPDVVVVEEMER